MAKIFKNNHVHLTKLDLSFCEFNEKGFTTLIDSLRGISIQSLILDGNSLINLHET
jgi:hypothetical protein